MKSENRLLLRLPDNNGMSAGTIAGVDEAGRGPLAGAVVAAAVILPDNYDLPRLNDSKRLSPKRRECLYELITAQAVAWAVASVSAAEIDQLNILQASLLAMHRAVTQLSRKPALVYVDGNRCPAWEYDGRAVIGGDARIASIAAASILAKVVRDRQLLTLHERFPGYGFDAHKGYPTATHLEKLACLGPCPEHRRSFAPVARVVAQMRR